MGAMRQQVQLQNTPLKLLPKDSKSNSRAPTDSCVSNCSMYSLTHPEQFTVNVSYKLGKTQVKSTL